MNLVTSISLQQIQALPSKLIIHFEDLCFLNQVYNTLTVRRLKNTTNNLK